MRTILFALALTLQSSLYAQGTLPVGEFSSGKLDDWERKVYVKDTQYQLVNDDGRQVLDAVSQSDATAIYRKISVDLSKTPILNWSWKLKKSIVPADEKQKAGDDYAARVYVVKSGGLFPWKTKAINYVWSAQHSKGQSWNNPFAGEKAKMVSIQDGQSSKQQWLHEKRNVIKDFKTLYDVDIDEIDGVAIMTDSDNTGQSAHARYGDIYFTAE